jgi:hypothetical protein
LPGADPVIAWLMHLEAATQIELSRLIGIEQPTMAHTLHRMERDGTIKRSWRLASTCRASRSEQARPTTRQSASFKFNSQRFELNDHQWGLSHGCWCANYLVREPEP